MQQCQLSHNTTSERSYSLLVLNHSLIAGLASVGDTREIGFEKDAGVNSCEVGVIEVERSGVVGESQELLVSDYLKRGNEISWQLFQNKYWRPK